MVKVFDQSRTQLATWIYTKKEFPYNCLEDFGRNWGAHILRQKEKEKGGKAYHTPLI